MVDQRLEALGTDYIDLFFIHGLGDDHSLDDAIKLVKSQEFKETAEAIRKSGKAKFVGFSTHHRTAPRSSRRRPRAASSTRSCSSTPPGSTRTAPLNRALDACWKKGIGLISMKQVAGKQFGNAPKGDILDEVVRRVPMLAEKKLWPFQGLLHAIWTDERISSCCVSMRNTDQIRENADAARRFEPLKLADIHQLRDAVLAQGPTLCADCDGRCSTAAGTTAELGDLTRFLTYHEHHGDRSEARRAVRRARPRGARLGGRRPRGRPRRLPQPARLRPADARGRATTWPDATGGILAIPRRGLKQSRALSRHKISQDPPRHPTSAGARFGPALGGSGSDTSPPPLNPTPPLSPPLPLPRRSVSPMIVALPLLWFALATPGGVDVPPTPPGLSQYPLPRGRRPERLGRLPGGPSPGKDPEHRPAGGARDALHQRALPGPALQPFSRQPPDRAAPFHHGDLCPPARDPVGGLAQGSRHPPAVPRRARLLHLRRGQGLPRRLDPAGGPRAGVPDMGDRGGHALSAGEVRRDPRRHPGDGLGRLPGATTRTRPTGRSPTPPSSG